MNKKIRFISIALVYAIISCLLIMPINAFDESRVFGPISEIEKNLHSESINTLESVVYTSEDYIPEHFENINSEDYISNYLKNADSIINDEDTSAENSIEEAPEYSWVEQTWVVEPHIVRQERWINYTTQWVGIDAYRSSVGLTLSTSQSQSVSFKIEFTGSKDIKDRLGLSVGLTITNTFTLTAGTTAPAWTYVAFRPYTRFYKNYYEGKMRTKIYVDGLCTYDIIDTVTGVHDEVIDKTYEVFSVTNTNHLPNATTPLPPTGVPNA